MGLENRNLERDSDFRDYLEETTSASIDSAVSTAENDRFMKDGSLVRKTEEVVGSPERELASI